MDIRNRLADVDRIRCRILQDFLKMVICPNWRENLFEYVKNQITQNQNISVYKPIYNKMKDEGISNYCIEYMDATAIIAVIKYSGIVIVARSVKDELDIIRKDRNASLPHLNSNEKNDELYLRGIISLLNLMDLIRIIDNEETSIDETLRKDFRQKYIVELEKLKNLLDDERIRYVVMRREVEKDIKAIMDASTPQKEWVFRNLMESYHALNMAKRHDEYTQEKVYLFYTMASEAGIKEAYSMASNIIVFRGNASDLEKQLKRMLDDEEQDRSQTVIEDINHYLDYNLTGKQNDITEGLLDIIEIVRKKGHSVVKNEQGKYVIIQ